MENINTLESGFQIKSIILIESSFNRIINVVFEEGIVNDLNIKTDIGVSEKVITVTEEVAVVQKLKGIEQVNIKVKMVGIFKCVGESSLTDFEEFGRVNGAAIIFPYIREHITHLSLKGGIGAIILPPINFTNKK